MSHESRISQDFFFVQLFSNSTSKNVDNSTSNFTNTLAKTIHLPKNENWHMALNFILCSNKFNVKTEGEEGTFEYTADKDDYNLSQIYIKCKQIQQLHDGRQLLSCHSRKPYNSKDNRIHYYEPSNLLYFPVNVQELTDISISLHKSNLEPLFLRRSQPTTLSLKFMRMTERIIPIYVSSRGKGAEEENRASKFTVSIPPYYNNYSSFVWQIALASITYIADFRVFPSHYSNNAYFQILYYPEDDEIRLNSVEFEIQVQESIVVLDRPTIDNWRSEQDIRRYLHNLMEELKFPDGQPMSSAVRFTNLFKEEEEGETVTYTGPISLTFIRICQFLMPAWLADILGFRKFRRTMENTSNIAIFAPQEPTIIFAKEKMDAFRLIPNSMNIICDAIQPLLTGGIESKVLKTIPVKHTFNKQQPSETFEPKNWQYHNLISREISSFSFYLVDIAGNEIEFANENQDIIIGLVLKITV